MTRCCLCTLQNALLGEGACRGCDHAANTWPIAPREAFYARAAVVAQRMDCRAFDCQLTGALHVRVRHPELKSLRQSRESDSSCSAGVAVAAFGEHPLGLCTREARRAVRLYMALLTAPVQFPPCRLRSHGTGQAKACTHAADGATELRVMLRSDAVGTCRHDP